MVGSACPSYEPGYLHQTLETAVEYLLTPSQDQSTSWKSLTLSYSSVQHDESC